VGSVILQEIINLKIREILKNLKIKEKNEFKFIKNK
jgi:hypothetical protein